jgi:UDP-N-acetylmuramoyl-tripeptide--D-alanyl-D-alanine ligase
MVERSLDEAVSAMGGVLQGAALQGAEGAARWSGAAIDSRKVAGLELFFALPGEKADGHDFVAQALARGAAAAVISRPVAATGVKIEVTDTFAALHDLTRAIRRSVPQSLVGITGSAGKTTTKELLAALLGQRFKVAKSPGNLNNLYGFPLSLLGIADDTEWMIAEMGMSTPGELREVSRLGRPDIAVFTNVRAVHLENFPDLDGIAAAKSELLAGVADGGLMIANADDHRVMAIAERFARERGGQVVTYGLGAASATFPAHFRGENLVALAESDPSRVGSAFDLVWANGRHRLELPIHGLYNVENCLAALACALTLDLTIPEIEAGLKTLVPAAHRGEVVRLGLGMTLIDDCYNSNPDAAQKALAAAKRLPAGRRIAILGDMLELGPRELELHAEVGATAAALDFSLVVAIGRRAQALAEAFKAAGGQVQSHENAAAAAAWVREFAWQPGDLVLVKASRGMALEVVVDALIATCGGQA